jgi:hypothetical protein
LQAISAEIPLRDVTDEPGGKSCRDASRDDRFHERLSEKGLTVAGRHGLDCRGGRRRPVTYPVAGAIQWLWSFRRLWLAVISRHSDRTAALPLRWKRSIRRLPLIWPNTGSMLYFRLA